MTTFKQACSNLWLPIEARLEKTPIIAPYALTHGLAAVATWAHRLIGLLLIVFLGFHLLTLSTLLNPDVYNRTMTIMGYFPFPFFEWALAVPVIFHALNGGRLMLIETFGQRNDGQLLRWVLALSVIYLAALSILMIQGQQSVTPFFFWLISLLTALAIGYLAGIKLFTSKAPLTWKLHRLTGAFLLILIPAHFLFMHLSPAAAHEANVVIGRMKSPFIKLVDFLILVAVVYHAAYGLLAITRDYLASRLIKGLLIVIIPLVAIFFALIGLKLLISI